MAAKGRTDDELWVALEGLDEDLLDPHLPEALVDDELKAIGVDPMALGARGAEFVQQIKEEERLSWQTRAQERRAQLAAQASKAAIEIPASMGRQLVLARLEELRNTNSTVGNAIRMAARKRKPEESTDEELRLLLQEMETLRAMEEADK
jgi:hypothetical protein